MSIWINLIILYFIIWSFSSKAFIFYCCIVSKTYWLLTWFSFIFRFFYMKFSLIRKCWHFLNWQSCTCAVQCFSLKDLPQCWTVFFNSKLFETEKCLQVYSQQDITAVWSCWSSEISASRRINLCTVLVKIITMQLINIK